MAYTINTLSNIAPVLLREGLLALRENSIMARLALFDVSEQAAKKGATIDVELPSAVPAQEVAVAAANTPTPLVPTVVPVTLDYWWESVFSMSDKDMTEVEAGTLPASASEAVKSLANKVDISLLGLYKSFYGYAGAAGTTPDAVDDITETRKMLNKQLCPLDARALVIDVEAESKFLQLAAFHEVDKTGDTAAMREGSLGRRFGFDIHMDQNVLYHTCGTLAGGAGGVLASKAIVAAGLKTAVLDNGGAGTLTGTVVVGDLFTIAGHTQSYVITEAAEAAANEITLKFEPGLQIALADGTVFTKIASHRVNLGFRKDALCFVSRPLVVAEGLGSIVEAIIDPLSGLTLRLEITRANKQIRWSYDILWGVKTIRLEYGVRLLG